MKSFLVFSLNLSLDWSIDRESGVLHRPPGGETRCCPLRVSPSREKLFLLGGLFFFTISILPHYPLLSIASFFFLVLTEWLRLCRRPLLTITYYYLLLLAIT